jgi:hypothetical protein
MAAIDMSLLAARSEFALHQLVKRRKNWAQREPGVIVVFVIVFLVACLVIALFINKKVCRPYLRVYSEADRWFRGELFRPLRVECVDETK